MADGAFRCRKDRSAQADDTVFVHCCCAKKGNIVAKPVEGQGLKIHDVTKEHDLTGSKTVREIIQNIKGLGDVFLYCSPCAGGSTWQRLNLELAKRKGWNKTIEKLIDHWDLHWRLWERFEQVV